LDTDAYRSAPDSRIFKPRDKRIARERSGINGDDIVVGYFGSIHKPRGADDLIAAVERIRAQGRDIKLLMAGRDYGDVSLGLPWIDYRGMVKQEDVVVLINSCDVVTIPHKDTENIRMTSACKLMEYFACGVPVVVSDVSDYASYFPEHFMCVSRPSDPASLADAITNQLEAINVVDANSVISWEKLTAQLNSHIRQLGTDNLISPE
jgi:glycosyltransferase involved in cell wall biosynthesis